MGTAPWSLTIMVLFMVSAALPAKCPGKGAIQSQWAAWLGVHCSHFPEEAQRKAVFCLRLNSSLVVLEPGAFSWPPSATAAPLGLPQTAIPTLEGVRSGLVDLPAHGAPELFCEGSGKNSLRPASCQPRLLLEHGYHTKRGLPSGEAIATYAIL